jgi:hypothetical protein
MIGIAARCPCCIAPTPQGKRLIWSISAAPSHGTRGCFTPQICRADSLPSRQLRANHDQSAMQQSLNYSITSSARASKVGGTSMPSERAVCRLRANSNLVGCKTGRSAGLAPLMMLPV